MIRLACWVLAGLLGGGLLGLTRTRAASEALLQKNLALIELGLPALPGPGHLDTLTSWKPALAGGLFFALTLGLSFSALSYLWARLARTLFSRWKPLLAAALALPLGAPVWAFHRGDAGLAIALLAMAAAATLSAMNGPAPSAPDLARGLVAAVLVMLSISPLTLAVEGSLIRVRNQLLLSNPVGMAVNDFYYNWTLYPAQAVKPLAVHTQPLVSIAPQLDTRQRRRICNNLLASRVLCVDDATPGVDARLRKVDHELALISGETRVVLTGSGGAAVREAWAALSDETDRSAPLRLGTFNSLKFGLPVAFCLLLYTLTGAFAERFNRRFTTPRRREAVRWGLYALPLLLLFVSLLPGERVRRYMPLIDLQEVTHEEVLNALDSDDPVLRHYGALATVKVISQEYEAELLAALDDPIINVRYAAALSLNPTGPESRERLLTLLADPDREWYVKERAWSALWRSGWRPR